MLEIRGAFEAGGASGGATIAARAAAVDELVTALWEHAVERDPHLRNGVALVAIGGYGRRELFPYSDVDLLFLLDGKVAEKDVKDAVRRVNQEMWDCGDSGLSCDAEDCRVRTVRSGECGGCAGADGPPKGDGRWRAVYVLAGQSVPKLLQREHKALMVTAAGADA